MADRPLRPATRRCLGRPLPHQLADRPRAPPEAESISSPGHATRWGHPVLAPVSRGYPGLRGRLLTCYSPVRHSVFTSVATGWTSFDLHVLGTPPAFVLSQDQTLHRRSALDPEGSGRHRRAGSGLATLADMKLAQHGLLSVTVLDSWFDRACPSEDGQPRSPALAFGSHCSVFKERRGTHRRGVGTEIPAPGRPVAGLPMLSAPSAVSTRRGAPCRVRLGAAGW